MDERVRHDWLIWTREGILTGHFRGERSREKDRLFLDHSTSPAFSSHHFFLLSFCYSFLSSVLWSASCIALAHARSQHQSALLRDFWVFNHALPQLLLFPIWIHPVHLIPVAFTLRGKTNTKICSTLKALIESLGGPIKSFLASYISSRYCFSFKWKNCLQKPNKLDTFTRVWGPF